jgi:hypothetical protein
MRFEIGDRVKYMGEPYRVQPGYEGTVVKITDDGDFICVMWDKLRNGHSCGGLCPDGMGWNIRAHDLYILENELTKSNPYWRVCHKVNSLEMKRKELGYAF